VKQYLFDTHALIFWRHKIDVTDKFLAFFDQQAEQGNLFCSAINFWEIALLDKKGRISISDIEQWHVDLLACSSLHTIIPSSVEMIRSVSLPDIHKDPFDRLLVAQAQHHAMTLISKDALVMQYDVQTIWL